MKKRIMLIALAILCLLFMSWSVCMAKAGKDFEPPTISHDVPSTITLFDLPVVAVFTIEDNKEVAYYVVQYDQESDRNRIVYLPAGIVSQDFSVPLDFRYTNTSATPLVAASDSAGNISRLVLEVTLDTDCPGCDLDWDGERIGADLSGIDFAYADLSGASLRNRMFQGTDFSYANLVETDFSSDNPSWPSVLSRNKFIGADLRFANFKNVSVNTNEFNDANLEGAKLTEAYEVLYNYWNNTICPDGTNSDNNGGTCLGHLTP